MMKTSLLGMLALGLTALPARAEPPRLSASAERATACLEKQTRAIEIARRGFQAELDRYPETLALATREFHNTIEFPPASDERQREAADKLDAVRRRKDSDLKLVSLLDETLARKKRAIEDIRKQDLSPAQGNALRRKTAGSAQFVAERLFVGPKRTPDGATPYEYPDCGTELAQWAAETGPRGGGAPVTEPAKQISESRSKSSSGARAKAPSRSGSHAGSGASGSAN